MVLSNLGNMKTIDLFCTNKDYEPISIDKTIINLLEEDDVPERERKTRLNLITFN